MWNSVREANSNSKVRGIDEDGINIQNNDLENKTSGRYKETRSECRINEGFIPESEESTSRRNGQQTQCTGTFAAENPLDQSADAPVMDTPVKISEEKRETTQMYCINSVFRNKLLRTSLLLWSSACVGWAYGQMGPIFPDLQNLVGVSLKQGSWLFSGFAIGYLAGCLLGGLALGKFNANIVMCLFSLLVAISTALLPWIPVFPLMVFLRVLTGLGVGVQDTGNVSLIFLIWGNKAGPYNQMIYVFFSLGGIAAPLVTKPFLTKVSEEVHAEVFNTTEHTLNVFDNTTNTEQAATESTNVHCALLITGLMYLTIVLPFLFAFVKENPAQITKEPKDEKRDNSVEKKLPKHIERTVLFLLLMNSLVATACFDLFPSYLTTFLIEELNWSQQDGSTLTSLFFAMHGVGTFINIFGSIYINSAKIMILSFISCIVTYAGILLSISLSHAALIRGTVSLVGIVGANIIPLLYTWTHEYVTPVTGAIASGLLISGSLGLSLNPLLVGYMMDEYSPMWFIYLSFGDIVICAILFFAAMVLVKAYTIKTKAIGIEIKVTESDISSNGYMHRNIEITRF